MRKLVRWVLGLGAVMGLAMVLVGATRPLDEAQAAPQGFRPASVTEEKGLIVVPLSGDDTAEMLSVIDPAARVMSVYRIDRTTGKITLCSVRSIEWDLKMSEFNGESPLPLEIRAMLDPR